MADLTMFQSNRISMTLEEFLNYRDAQMDLAKLRAYAENAVVTYSDGTKHRDTYGIAYKVFEMLDIPEKVIEEAVTEDDTVTLFADGEPVASAVPDKEDKA